MMARIRTVKPDFFRHEKLQDLEVKHPGKYIMLVFEGLWTLCDSKGKFIFNPRMIKLDVLPFIPFSMEETLGVLEVEGFIEKYEVDGELYGRIPTFNEHQRITGKEAAEGEKHPNPRGKQRGNKRETHEKHPDAQEGKGKEGNGIAPDGAQKREPDLLWEALLAGCGINLKANHTESERGAWNKVLKQLKAAGATPEEITGRCAAYKLKWPGMLTPTALAKHWSECAPVVTELRPRKMLGEE